MSKQTYDGNSISILEGLEAVRKRPGMYIGSVSTKGLIHLIYEIVDNSVDEYLAGYCNEISVSLEPDGVAVISDNGRGIPTDIHPKALAIAQKNISEEHLESQIKTLVADGLKNITVKAEGAGSIQGYGNGDPFFQGSYQQKTIPCFEGRVQAAVRAGFETGEATVTFSAEGCEPAKVRIMVKESVCPQL